MNSSSPPVTVTQLGVKRQLLLLVDVVELFHRNVSVRQVPSHYCLNFIAIRFRRTTHRVAGLCRPSSPPFLRPFPSGTTGLLLGGGTRASRAPTDLSHNGLSQNRLPLAQMTTLTPVNDGKQKLAMKKMKDEPDTCKGYLGEPLVQKVTLRLSMTVSKNWR